MPYGMRYLARETLEALKVCDHLRGHPMSLNTVRIRLNFLMHPMWNTLLALVG